MKTLLIAAMFSQVLGCAVESAPSAPDNLPFAIEPDPFPKPITNPVSACKSLGGFLCFQSGNYVCDPNRCGANEIQCADSSDCGGDAPDCAGNLSPNVNCMGEIAGSHCTKVTGYSDPYESSGVAAKQPDACWNIVGVVMCSSDGDCARTPHGELLHCCPMFGGFGYCSSVCYAK